ncbi:MAG: ABC transporter substrate-binding protein [Flavobacteriales bacterium]|jgi:iron complex transport system substrate-binding protein|uniref:ABC transporter substrate-binding protein n=1 Tax=Candidatus Ulvibacter alkanivorans TaxID=2267620 RepID=UPI000DF343F7|nr:ABC transporter substrate-binding protein [Candidatus Ulvibacter alkanivorans]MCH2488832.1 ABC transporter substrate-binding protein [Flavobacteriales bacterium]
MQKFCFLFIFVLILVGCNSETKKNTTTVSEEKIATTVTYANGFTVQQQDAYKVITLTNPWPGADKQFTYALVDDKSVLPASETFDAVINIPVETIVVTSTTHIPSLEMLQVSESLIGFPNLDYISSEATRKLISDGNVKELGKNEDINTEVLIELDPDVVVGFAVDGNNTTFSTIQKTGIPVVYNADWTETHPLGKAEWIKFFGLLFGKEQQADSIFNTIETEYRTAKKIAKNATTQPTVLSGAMYKDVWYLPQGDSWAAQFIADANGNYLWSDTEGTGSISANLEAVLDKGQDADYWIGPGQFTSLKQLQEAHSVYAQFNAFQQQKVFSFTNKKGPNGGVLYYELAPNRPDIVLKDIIKILHPNLLPDHNLYFFSTLE